MAVIFFKIILFATIVVRSLSDPIVKSRYYPRYHLAPPYGWMNDPNGFSIFENEYHLFYQYNPESSLVPGIAHWGHAKSKDLFDWEHLPIAMYPDKWYDIGGVFSGSAIVQDNTMYIFYTGNINDPGEVPEREEYQALATSTDGVNVLKYENNPIIYAPNRQPNIRDPKVWVHNGKYYMVIGNSYTNPVNESQQLGQALLYVSENMLDWQEVSVLYKSTGFLGYMFECPDFFELDGLYVLLFSPQGVKPDGDKYRNLYQTGYIIGFFDYNTNLFVPLTEFFELDHGHDFYATQTILDASGNRVMVAWNDMWEEYYPEKPDGFTGQMTIPRTLNISPMLRIKQKPVTAITNVIGRSLRSGRGEAGTKVVLEDKTGKVDIEASPFNNLEVVIAGSIGNGTVTLSFDVLRSEVTLNRFGNDGIRRTYWRPIGQLRWTVYIDASSIELFCGDGEITFSSRYFPDGEVSVFLGDDSDVDNFSVYTMKRTVPVPYN